MRAAPLVVAGIILSACVAFAAELWRRATFKQPSSTANLLPLQDERHAIQDDLHPGWENDPSTSRKGWQEKLRHLET